VTKTPKYWMDEVSGELAATVVRFVKEEPLSVHDIAYMRAYLRQWIFADVWPHSEELDGLRDGIDSLTNRANIERWLQRAIDWGVDPL